MLHVLRRYVLVYTRQTHVKGFASVAPPSEQLDKFRASFSQHEIEVRREAAASARGIIKLNIGGVEHTTSLATLTAVPGTYFTALLCGDLNQALTSSGELFVDRQGKVQWR